MGAPRQLHCDRAVWLCPVLAESYGSCSGYGGSRWYARFVDTPAMPTSDEIAAATPTNVSEPLLLHEEGQETSDECYAQGRFAFVGKVSEQELLRHKAQWEREAEVERKSCEARVERGLEKELVRIRCDVLLVNPCRNEAFTRCSGQNTQDLDRAELPKLNQIVRYEWRAPAEGD